MSGYEIVNVPCIAYGYTFLCCTPLAHGFLVSVPFAWQTYRIRKLGDLDGTCAADVLKTWFCTCCSLIQNEKESNLLIEGRTTGFWGGDGAGADGVVVRQPSGGLGEVMVMPVAMGAGEEEGGTTRVEERAEIVELAGEPVAGLGKEEHVEHVNGVHSHTDGVYDRNTSSESDVSHRNFSRQTSEPQSINEVTEQKTVTEDPTSDKAVVQLPATPQHTTCVASAQIVLPDITRHLDKLKNEPDSGTVSKSTRNDGEVIAA